MSKRSIDEYKIIDFHTHIFPDAVAKRASDNVGDYYGLKMNGDGTLARLLSGKENLNVCKFVISSAAMNPLKVKSANNFIKASQNSNDKLIGFGSLHPDAPELQKEIDYLLTLSLYGLKLHPDFQKFNIDDESMFPIYERLSGVMPILFHVGDVNSDMSSPRRLKRVMELFPKLDVIAAHMGGYSVWKEAEDYLVGTRAYFDTSNSWLYIPDDDLVSMIRRHGVEKIFFGSDYPLTLTADAARKLHRINLTDLELEDIFYNNAARFLKLK